MSQALCPHCSDVGFAAAIPLRRPWWDRAATAVLESAQASFRRWQLAKERMNTERALRALDGRTLRDLGFGEYAAPREAALWTDVERTRW